MSLHLSEHMYRRGERPRGRKRRGWGGMMVSTRRKRAQSGTETSENVNKESESNNGGGGKGGGSWGTEYEEFRDKRIKENKERMQMLGILDLSLKLRTQIAPPKKTPRNASPSSSSYSEAKPHISLALSSRPRRSSRLKDLTPVNYKENPIKNKIESSKNVEIRLREGSQPEIYTEEDEKLLGDCKTPWTLSVDGCGKDGKRIYDQEKGETCHQCRQKTLGLHTRCSKCSLVQGQFCGDCLYTRYGENVIEVNQNLDWICPVCRGICNCSRCRHAKGWAPTGCIYKKVTNLGFKSVAHFLIQTRNPQSYLEESCAESVTSEEKELPFAVTESELNHTLSADKHLVGFSDPRPDNYKHGMDEIEK